MYLASTSFPVPVSPKSKTVALVRATRSARRSISLKAGEDPMMSAANTVSRMRLFPANGFMHLGVAYARGSQVREEQEKMGIRIAEAGLALAIQDFHDADDFGLHDHGCGDEGAGVEMNLLIDPAKKIGMAGDVDDILRLARLEHVAGDTEIASNSFPTKARPCWP